MNKKIEVLDHGLVRLVDHMGDDLSIVRAARVSYNTEWRSGDDEGKDKKLIHYLMKNRHTSPFEMVQFTFEIKAPIFVFRQWHRHRTWSYNEISARYSELPKEFYIPQVHHIGTQSKHNKQMRDMDDQDGKRGCIHFWRYHVERLTSIMMMRNANKESFDTYQILLARGVPRELARSVLPVATYTRMFASVDLHNLFHFLKLRLHEHAQYEIRVYAEAMLALIEPIVPVAVSAFREYGLENTE